MYDNEKMYKIALIVYVICWIGMVICVGIAVYNCLVLKSVHPVEIIATAAMTIVASGGLKEVKSYFQIGR